MVIIIYKNIIIYRFENRINRFIQHLSLWKLKNISVCQIFENIYFSPRPNSLFVSMTCKSFTRTEVDMSVLRGKAQVHAGESGYAALGEEI